MYHTHMDEEDQLSSGMYAPLLVLEPGERHDPATDITMMVESVPNSAGGFTHALNGAIAPEPRRIRAGATYRLRIVNLLRIGTGEAYDFRWMAAPGEYLLKIQLGGPPGSPLPPPLLQKIISQQ